MQTFLPEPDIILSLERLDWRRLGKQRVEALQILNALNGKSLGWTNHPATKMWRGYELALMFYHDMACIEWMCRDYNNGMELYDVDEDSVVLPPWFGNVEFHRSHQSNLVRKDPDHYRQFWPDVPDDLPYVWPVD